MGYFNDNSLGELTGVCTHCTGQCGDCGPHGVGDHAGRDAQRSGLYGDDPDFDWRIGLICGGGRTAVYLFITSRHGAKSAAPAPHRQKSEAKLVEAVLEYVQGMSVVKSFNLTGRGRPHPAGSSGIQLPQSEHRKDVHPLYHGAGDRAPAGKRGHDALSGMVLSPGP